MADFVSGTANSDVYGEDIIWLGEWAKNNYVRPLDDLIARDIPAGELADFLPGAFNALSKWDGKTWTMPFGAYYFLMYYRQDVFQKGRAFGSGHSRRRRRRCRETHGQEGKNFYGISMPYQRGGPISSWFLATYTGAGGKLLKDPPNDFAPTLDSPEALKVLDALLKLAEGGAAGAIGHHWNDQTVAMQAGRLAMAPTFSINGPSSRSPTCPDRRQGRFHHAAAPYGGTGARDPVRRLGHRHQRQDNKVEDSWTFIKWLTSAKVQKQLALVNGTPVRFSALRDREGPGRCTPGLRGAGG